MSETLSVRLDPDGVGPERIEAAVRGLGCSVAPRAAPGAPMAAEAPEAAGDEADHDTRGSPRGAVEPGKRWFETRKGRLVLGTGGEAGRSGRDARASASAMQLRYFTAWNDIANDRTSTIVFPLPMDLLGKIAGDFGLTAEPAGAQRHGAARPWSATAIASVAENSRCIVSSGGGNAITGARPFRSTPECGDPLGEAAGGSGAVGKDATLAYVIGAG